jgi:hypothetical protein
MTVRPPQVPRCEGTVSDDPIGITHPAGVNLGLECDARRLRDRPHNLPHGRSYATAEVVDRFECRSRHHCVRSAHVRQRDIGDVNVVADTRSVLRRIITSKNLWRVPRGQRIEDKREKVVRARVVNLVGSRSNNIEIAQTRVDKTLSDPLIADEPLTD